MSREMETIQGYINGEAWQALYDYLDTQDNGPILKQKHWYIDTSQGSFNLCYESFLHKLTYPEPKIQPELAAGINARFITCHADPKKFYLSWQLNQTQHKQSLSSMDHMMHWIGQGEGEYQLFHEIFGRQAKNKFIYYAKQAPFLLSLLMKHPTCRVNELEQVQIFQVALRQGDYRLMRYLVEKYHFSIQQYEQQYGSVLCELIGRRGLKIKRQCKCLVYLLKQGADANQLSKKGYSPLQKASGMEAPYTHTYHLGIMKILLEAGAKHHLNDCLQAVFQVKQGQAILASSKKQHWTQRQKKLKRLKFVKYLLQQGASLESLSLFQIDVLLHDIHLTHFIYSSMSKKCLRELLKRCEDLGGYDKLACGLTLYTTAKEGLSAYKTSALLCLMELLIAYPELSLNDNIRCVRQYFVDIDKNGLSWGKSRTTHLLERYSTSRHFHKIGKRHKKLEGAQAHCQRASQHLLGTIKHAA